MELRFLFNMNYEERIEELKRLYRATHDPVRRQIIIRRAKALKYSQGIKPEQLDMIK